MSERTETPAGTSAVAQLSPLSHFARYGFPGIVAGILLLSFLWAGKLMVERVLRHFDTIEVSFKEQAIAAKDQAAAIGATARGIEGLVVSTTKIQESMERGRKK